MNKIYVLEKAAKEILDGRIECAKGVIQDEYPFKKLVAVGRSYTDKQKMKQFKKDGLTALFIKLVEADHSLLEDAYIKKWHRLSK